MSSSLQTAANMKEGMRVVVFHNVVAHPLDEFDRRLYRTHLNGFVQALQTFQARYEIIPLPETLRRLAEGTPSPNSLTLTFDDGFAGVYEHVFPLLDELGVAGSVFLPTQPAGPNGEDGSPDRLFHFEVLEIAFRLTQVTSLDLSSAGLEQVLLGDPAARARGMDRLKTALKRLPADAGEQLQERVLYELKVDREQIEAYAVANTARYRKLSVAQIRELQEKGWTLGGHTRTHPALSTLPPARVSEEIIGNLKDLTLAFGLTNPPFAYPYGTSELVGSLAPGIVRQAGFECAFTTVQQPLQPSSDRFLLGRYSEKDLLHGGGKDAIAMAGRLLRVSTPGAR